MRTFQPLVSSVNCLPSSRASGSGRAPSRNWKNQARDCLKSWILWAVSPSLSELMLRQTVVGIKNWLFARSEGGPRSQRTATHWSVAVCCRESILTPTSSTCSTGWRTTRATAFTSLRLRHGCALRSDVSRGVAPRSPRSGAADGNAARPGGRRGCGVVAAVGCSWPLTMLCPVGAKESSRPANHILWATGPVISPFSVEVLQQHKNSTLDEAQTHRPSWCRTVENLGSHLMFYVVSSKTEQWSRPL